MFFVKNCAFGNFIWSDSFLMKTGFLCYVSPLNVQEFSNTYTNAVFLKVNVDENDVSWLCMWAKQMQFKSPHQNIFCRSLQYTVDQKYFMG